MAKVNSIAISLVFFIIVLPPFWGTHSVPVVLSPFVRRTEAFRVLFPIQGSADATLASGTALLIFS